jgi:hypothetical protein
MFFRLPAAGDEHGADVYEGAGCAESGPPGEQQFLRREHQHRARGLRVVRGAGGLLGRPLRALREERGEFPARLLVAEYERRGAVVCRQFLFPYLLIFALLLSFNSLPDKTTAPLISPFS